MYGLAAASAALVMLLGVLGTIVPVLPGLPMVWLAAFGFAWWDGFRHVGAGFLGLTLALVVLAAVAEYAVRAWGVQKFGGTRAGSWGAVIGAFAGLLFMPLGLVLGPFLGAVVGESLAGAEGKRAMSAGFGSLLGVFAGVIMNLLLGITILAGFLYQVIGGV